MSKRWHTQVSNTDLDCRSLGSSLKRVRISPSPGELRLERDLKDLAASDSPWTSSSEKLWLHRNNRLERCASDPLRLLLTVGQIHVTIQFPRLYPHRPPVVSRVAYPCSTAATPHPTLFPTSRQPRLEQVLVTVAPPFSTNESNEIMMKSHGTVVYDKWSPVQCLGDLLRFVVAVLEQQPHGMESPSQHGDSMETENLPRDNQIHESHRSQQSQGVSWREASIHDAQERINDCNDARKLKDVFPPNRFDVGYEKKIEESLTNPSKDVVWIHDGMET